MQRVKSRNNGAFGSNRISLNSGFGSSDTEGNLTKKDVDQVSRASSLYSEASSPGLVDENDLEAISSNGLDVVEEDSVAAPVATKKPRRLSKLFGLSRRTGRDP